jgi:N-carbamoyl-L-amino-acid hydrolase
MVGSQAMTGLLDLSTVADLVDDAGFALKDAMQAVGLDVNEVGGAQRDLSRIRGFVELHIEQGPVLDSAKAQIGVVTGIAGLYKLRCRFIGLAGHAGTNPMNLRRDALAGMTHLHTRLPELTKGDAVATIGRVDVTPNAANVIPGEVTFTVDLRTTDLDALKALRAAIANSGAEIAETLNLSFEYEELSHFKPVTCSPQVVGIVESLADRFRYSHLRMPSGAAHDAMNFRAVDRKGMIFVPSLEGISHNILEETEDKDLIAGGNVLTNTLIELAQ